ncbi:MAG: 50S ribosomal protein L29 [Bdellovibrionales bacterium]
MKFSEIKNLKYQELIKKLQELRKNLFDSRMKLKMQRLPNPLTIRLLRKDIARVQTALSFQKGVKNDKK